MIQRNAAAAACHFTMAIRQDHVLWAWGAGPLGDGTRERRLSPLPSLDRVAAVSASREHAAAIRLDGSLWVWGSNRFGKIGDGTVSVYDSKDRPIEDHDP